jgi:hypothetical protein
VGCGARRTPEEFYMTARIECLLEDINRLEEELRDAERLNDPTAIVRAKERLDGALTALNEANSLLTAKKTLLD